MGEDYIYGVARVHARETRLLGAGDIQQLMACKTCDECLRVLTDKGWGAGDGNASPEAMLAAEEEKTWAFLMKGSDSPFWEGNQTFYIRNVDRLSESWCRQIQSMIMERELHRRSQLLFTCVQERGKGMPERVLRLVNLLSCSVARLPSLRECRGEIAMLASLYIAKKNVEFSKQILGFEPGAVELMQEYQWPYNYTQLKRVLDELTAVTPTSYISRRDIAHCLEKERQLFGGAGEGEAFDFDRPLHEIDRDIIRRQLSLAHGNQAAAARRLGISRTTLWRYLKDEKEGQ